MIKKFLSLTLLLFILVPASESLAKNLFGRVSPKVFQVKTALKATSPKASYGSGFAVSHDGFIVTNYHVISSVVMEKKNYQPFVDYKGKWTPATIVDVDVIHDLALLKVETKLDQILKFRAAKLPQGSRIYSFGLPEDLNMSVVEGTFNGFINHGPYRQIHISSPINSGMSGGPSTDANGEVIGVNVSTYMDSNNISFLVPAEFARKLFEENLKDPPKRDSEALIGRIAEQLKEAQAALTDEITHPEKSDFELGDWTLNRSSKALKCWSQNKDDDEKRFLSIEHKCFVDHSAYVKDGYNTGTFSVTYRTLKKKKTTLMQFFHLINRIYNGGDKYYEVFFSSFDYSDTFVTRYDCNHRFFRNANNIPIKVNYCMRGYVKFPQLYDIYLKGVTMTRSGEELIFYSQANGFVLNSVNTFVDRLVNSIANEKLAKK